MANFDESSAEYNWETEGVYQIEKNDPVEGGPDGISNRQGRQLTRRTRDLHSRLLALKTQTDSLIDQVKGGSVDAEYDTLLKLQHKLRAVESAINGDNGDALIETLQEALGFINDHKGEIESLVNTYVKKTSVADNLTTTSIEYVLSAKQGKVLKEMIEGLTATVNEKETPTGAQAKADAALVKAKAYTDTVAEGTTTSAKTYADGLIARLIDQSPEALDTFKELADALGNDPNFATTILTKLERKVSAVYDMGSLSTDANGNITLFAGSVTHPMIIGDRINVSNMIRDSENVIDTFLVIPANIRVSFSNVFHTAQEIDSITGTSSQKKVYTIKYLPHKSFSDVYYVDCKLYI